MYIPDVTIARSDIGRDPLVRAWQPPVAGITETLHASFREHVYPLHTHDTWTLLILDAGEVGYHLDRHHRTAVTSGVTLLPPNVPHDGAAASPGGFRKRVAYLDPELFDTAQVGAAVDHPGWCDATLKAAVHQLHEALSYPGEGFEAASLLALICERLRAHLTHTETPPTARRDAPLARRLRNLLDAHLASGITLAQVAALLHAHPTHLVRAFTRQYGIPPHRYLTGRRLDRARRLLLAGRPPSHAATEVGFYDQAHLTRHFRRFLATTPAAYARSGRDGVLLMAE